MPLFEVETDAHIIITWADDEQAAGVVVNEAYPRDAVIRLTKRPRDTWVISKGALGLTTQNTDPCNVARDCLSKAAGDKVHAIRLYMHETGSDLEHAQSHRIEYPDGLVASHPIATGGQAAAGVIAKVMTRTSCPSCSHSRAHLSARCWSL